MDDVQLAEEPVVHSSSGLFFQIMFFLAASLFGVGSPVETTPSEDAELAISTDVQLHIASEEQDVAGSPPAASSPTFREMQSQSSQHVRSQSSRWITPLAPTAGKSKTIYGGPKGFFKDVFAFRKSRSVSQSVQDAEGMYLPILSFRVYFLIYLWSRPIPNS